MPVVQPPPARYAIEDRGSSIRVVIPSRRSWVAVAFLSFWLVGWVFGEASVGGMLVSGLLGLFANNGTTESGAGLGAWGCVGLFSLAWFIGWTIGGAFVIYTLLWQLTGKEVIDISEHSIVIRRVVLGFSRPKEYLAEYIEALRVHPARTPMWYWSRRMEFWGMSGGALAFDYGAKTFYFAVGADEAEAKQILTAIERRFPILTSSSQ